MRQNFYLVNCPVHVWCTAASNWPVTSQTLKPINNRISNNFIFRCLGCPRSRPQHEIVRFGDMFEGGIPQRSKKN
jgi:hypothetical protein